MIMLPNGCKCSELSVHPDNWDTTRASVKKDWYIHYRFHDPVYAAKYPTGRLTIVKGMNALKTLSERQTMVEELLKMEMNQLKNLGYNPITRKHVTPSQTVKIVTPETPLPIALQYIYDNGGFEGQTKADLKSVLKYAKAAIEGLQLQYLAIGETKPSTMFAVLTQCGKIKENWTNNNYNAYKRYLSMFFLHLIPTGAIEINPMKVFTRKKHVKGLRRILTPKEAAEVGNYISNHDERFWVYIQIFYHSGSRNKEMMRVKGKHVDLENQIVTYLVLKRQEPTWVARTIKNIALPFWREALKGCGPEDYVFSKGLKPGPTPLGAAQITRLWKLYVKDTLGIESNFYWLKHRNTDEISAMLGLGVAAELNSHKSTKTTRIYAVNEEQRFHEKLKEVSNEFGQG